MSYRDETIDIISIAQHARPKVAGHIEFVCAQATAFSSVVSPSASSRFSTSSSKTPFFVGQSSRSDCRPAFASGRFEARERSTDLSSATRCSFPLERALAPDVDVGDGENGDEDQELDETEPAQLLEHDRERVEEDDLDVEEDEEHRRQVEADREALLFRRPLRDAGLEGQEARLDPPLRSGGEEERERDHRGRDRSCQQRVDQEGKVVPEHQRVAKRSKVPMRSTKEPVNRSTMPQRLLQSRRRAAPGHPATIVPMEIVERPTTLVSLTSTAAE